MQFFRGLGPDDYALPEIKGPGETAQDPVSRLTNSLFEVSWIWHLNPFEVEKLSLPEFQELGWQGVRLLKIQNSPR